MNKKKDLIHADVKLLPLTQSDRNQFVLDNQEAFNYGALVEFGLRDDHFEEEGKLRLPVSLSRTIFPTNRYSNARQ